MTEQEKAVVEAAKAWRNHPSDSRARALGLAVDRLLADTCTEQGIGGDPAWPVHFSCTKPASHSPARVHLDALRGEWRK